VITSVAILSINAARPSQVQVLFEQLKNQTKVSKKIAQIKNINFRIIIDDNQSNVERLDPLTHTWQNSKVPTVKWKNINVHSDELEISILPNGYTTSSVISLELDGFNYQFNPSLL
jgi:streptogramin lyase